MRKGIKTIPKGRGYSRVIRRPRKRIDWISFTSSRYTRELSRSYPTNSTSTTTLSDTSSNSTTTMGGLKPRSIPGWVEMRQSKTKNRPVPCSSSSTTRKSSSRSCHPKIRTSRDTRKSTCILSFSTKKDPIPWVWISKKLSAHWCCFTKMMTKNPINWYLRSCLPSTQSMRNILTMSSSAKTWRMRWWTAVVMKKMPSKPLAKSLQNPRTPRRNNSLNSTLCPSGKMLLAKSSQVISNSWTTTVTERFPRLIKTSPCPMMATSTLI